MLLALAAVFSLAAPAFAEEEVVTAEEPVVAEEPVEAAEVVEAEELVEEPEEVVEEPETEPETAATSGNCGDNVTWSFAGDTLTISGTGAMKDYDWQGGPWSDIKEQITTVIIQSGVTSIGAYAFRDCLSLTNVTLPDGVTTIGDLAFTGCDSLTSITIPASVTDIVTADAFNAASLTDIYVDSGSERYTSVDGVLFSKDMTELICYPHGKTATSYAIPNTVKTINYSAFRNCKHLTSMAIPSNVTKIWDAAFENCTSLASVTIPASVTSIEGHSFRNTPWLAAQGEFAIVNGILLRYQGSATNVTIPNSVTCIGSHSFSDCVYLTNVTIPDSVKTIELQAFSYTALTSVTLPDSVTKIGAGAFDGCDNLTSMTIPASVTMIEEWAFISCTSLANITIMNAKCKIAPTPTTLGVSDTTVVRGYTDSTAERYANNFGFKFESIGKAPGGTTPTNTPKPTATPKPQATAVPNLAAPTVTISQVSDGIKVSWNKITGSPRYMVYYRENGGAWTKIGTTTDTVYTRAAKYLTNGATYQFAVRCCANDKQTMLSGYKASNSVKYTVDLAAPTVKIEKASDGIKVSWNKIDGAPRYMVYYKENNGGWTKIGTTTSTTYTRAAKYLKSGATYQFTVRCCANDKKTMLGPYKASNSITYTAQLAAPTVKIAKVAGGIQVTWNKITGSPRYMVYYKEGNGGWKKIGTTTATSYTRAAKYLKNGVTYTFTVRCCENDKKTLLGPYKASNSLKYTK